VKKVQKDLTEGKSVKEFTAKAERDKHVERMVGAGPRLPPMLVC
jgi:hypothetical protein